MRPRSGLAVKHGVTVLNSPGTIDADYRGEVCVILINHGDGPFTIQRGDRIAQMIIAPVTQARLRETGAVTKTKRGAGGFGSTGILGTGSTKLNTGSEIKTPIAPTGKSSKSSPPKSRPGTPRKPP